MKILNLYAGIGGNRKLWKGHEITAVEIDPKIAKIYQDIFPSDRVIVGDAHEYLLKHFKEYDFIWSSPPCPTHSVTNNFQNSQGIIRYPDMKLYEEIIFLKHWFKGKWVVENVKSYYIPLIKPRELNRHYFWSNFFISNKEFKKAPFNYINARASSRKEASKYINSLAEYHGFNLDDFKIANKRLLLRNCVYPPLALHVFKCAFKNIQSKIKEEFK